MTSDKLGALEENLNATIRRLARAAVEMEDATAAYRASKATYDAAVRAFVESRPVTFDPRRDWTKCDGSAECPSTLHVHGCHSDHGACTEPGEDHGCDSDCELRPGADRIRHEGEA